MPAKRPPAILTYGDSNTFGTPPIEKRGEQRRFDAGTRWPQVMAAALGQVSLAEEGLPGRTTCHDDPVMGAFMNGWTGLHIALRCHGPLDVLTIMLGTNDFKTRFAPSAARIRAGVAGLLDIALAEDMRARHPAMQVLVIAPPPVRETGPIKGEFTGAEAIAPELAPALAALAPARGVHFLDAGAHIVVSARDGIHFEPEAHRILGAAVADTLRGILPG